MKQAGLRRDRAEAKLAYRVFKVEMVRREFGTLMLEVVPDDVRSFQYIFH